MSQDRSIEEIREAKMAELRGESTGGTGSDEGSSAPSEPVHVGDASELDRLVADHAVVLADFYADWCGPCQMLEPVVEDVAAETDAAVAKVDVDANQRLAREYGVQGVPTLVLFAGGSVADRLVGVQDKASLVAAVEQHG
jgi:thioredoxin 1